MTSMAGQTRALVFGASGMIGARIASGFRRSGVDLWASVPVRGRTSRRMSTSPISRSDGRPQTSSQPSPSGRRMNRVVWAQGVNSNDSVYEFSPESMRATFEANVVYVAETLQALLSRSLVLPRRGSASLVPSGKPSRARTNCRTAYSKAALQGFIASAAVDLATDRISLTASCRACSIRR